MYDVLIIGSGPAGYTAAIYASRAFLKTLVLAGPQPGGQLTTTTEVENFPGFPNGVDGSELLEKLKKQAERFGSVVINDAISNIKLEISNIHTKDKKDKNTFIVQGQSQTYEARAVIVATGASAQYLGLPSEQAFMGKGVSACATCDGFFFRGKEVVVVGGGDTAMEEATFLTRFATKVTIIHRRDEFRASPIMLAKAKKDKKISFLLNATVEEIVGDTKVTGVKIRVKTGENGEGGEVRKFPCDGVFLAIGHKPNTDFVKGLLEMDPKGYIYVKGLRKPGDLHTATNVPGIFAAGDCVDYQYRQAIVASGMGCMAAMDVMKYLES